MRLAKLMPVVLCIAIVLQLSSCVTLVTMQSVRPPVVQVANDQWKVLVVNRYDAAQHASNKNERVLEVLRDGAYQAAGGAMGAIYNDSTFVLVNPDTAVSLPSSPAAARLSQQETEALYKNYKPHLILTLDKFDVRLGKEVETYEDENGYRSKTANYNLIVTSDWSLYDSAGTVLDRSTISQQDFYDSRTVLSGLLAVGPAMGKTGPVVNRLAVETGYSYWDRLYPQPTLLVRQVHYAKGLHETVFLLEMGQYQQAISTLLPLAQNESNKHRAKAALNLAVAYEAAGNLEQALHWARQSESQGDKLAAELIGIWTNTGMLK